MMHRIMPTSIVYKLVDYLSVDKLPRYHSNNSAVITDPAITKYTFQLPVDTSRPVSSTCFETCAKQFEGGQLSYQEFLDATLAHIDPNSPARHPEDCDLANLARLSRCGPMGPVAAAIKLCMLRSETGFYQEVIDMLRRMNPSPEASSAELQHSALLELPPLQLQVVIVAALRRGLPGLATDILLSRPEPPKESLFNLLGSKLCVVEEDPRWPPSFGSTIFLQLAPITFWTAALRANWVMPSPALAYVTSELGPSAAPLLRTLLDDPALDVTLPTRDPLYKWLVLNVAHKQDDPSLLRDALARMPPDAMLKPPYLLRYAISQRSKGGVEMLALLLDHRDDHGRGLDINYRVKREVSIAERTDVWSGDNWLQESMTVLSKAVEMRNVDAVRFLISRGADVNEPEYGGWTPRAVALSRGYHEIVQMIDEAAKQKSQEN
ncbi:hypothetical protein HD806DRAFT_21681 [Xylariaceae sp. AK1471]|nr:hypothetical protein HD806DRAFT_21681 [Xylariaceae sp. AK1471]